jgi:hypothetical protein
VICCDVPLSTVEKEKLHMFFEDNGAHDPAVLNQRWGLNEDETRAILDAVA